MIYFFCNIERNVSKNVFSYVTNLKPGPVLGLTGWFAFPNKHSHKSMWANVLCLVKHPSAVWLSWCKSTNWHIKILLFSFWWPFFFLLSLKWDCYVWFYWVHNYLNNTETKSTSANKTMKKSWQESCQVRSNYPDCSRFRLQDDSTVFTLHAADIDIVFSLFLFCFCSQ